MARIKDQAICIRHLDWSETSQVVVLLTREHGKVRGLAKGSRRMTPSSVQKFSGGIELLTLGEIVFVTRQTSELATLTEWDLQNDFHHLRRSLPAQHAAMYAADLCHALLADHDPHPRAYEVLATFLSELVDPARVQGALLRFQWALLEDVGYRPELERDALTGAELADAAMYAFDPRAGGLTAQAGVGAQDWRVRGETVKLLRGVANGAGESVDEEVARRANRLLCAYARAILDHELPTMRLVLGGAV